ncbi:hypothetical protein ACET3Z_009111 [Daucus carota]
MVKAGDQPGVGRNDDDGFKVVQRKGKGKASEVRDQGQQGKRRGVQMKQQFRYANRGVVFRDEKEREEGMLEKTVIHKKVMDKDVTPVKIQNSFDVLNDDNSIQDPLMAKFGTEPIIKLVDNVGAQDGGGIMEVEHQKSATEVFDEGVKDYVFSGSKLVPAEMALMEKRIEEREKMQTRFNPSDYATCTTNTERDYKSEPDDSDIFMMQGIKNQGKDGDIGEWYSEDEVRPDDRGM